MEGNYFVDAHTHFVSFGLHLERPDLSKTKSLKEAINLLKKEVGKRGIIIGEDWDESRWEEKRFPAKEELDREFPDVPVIMRR
ncbi:amidohydrolase, partial [bacterium]